MLEFCGIQAVTLDLGYTESQEVFWREVAPLVPVDLS